MNSVAAKVTAFLLSLLMLAYVGYQAWLAFYNPYVTEAVYLESYVEHQQLDGFFVRSETVIEGAQTGVVGYNYQNGEKVAKNATVAEIYSSTEDLLLLQKINILQGQRDVLQEVQSKETSEGLKLDLLSEQISDYEMELIRAVDQNEFSTLDSISENLMFQINKFNSYVNKALSFESEIARLDTEIAQLQASVSPTQGSVTTSQSGYFSSTVDGWESILTPDILSDLTVERAAEILEQTTADSIPASIGRICTSDTWYFVALMTSKEAQSYTLNGTVTLKFTTRSTREVPATVVQIVQEEEQAAVIFSGDYLDENFVTMRFEKPTVQLHSYTGIIVPRDAIRIRELEDENGELVDTKVVYIQVGQSVQYRLLNIIYEDEDIVVSKAMNDSQYVAMYDQVILKGKDLSNAGS